jgi:hypothetical protein
LVDFVRVVVAAAGVESDDEDIAAVASSVVVVVVAGVVLADCFLTIDNELCTIIMAPGIVVHLVLYGMGIGTTNRSLWCPSLVGVVRESERENESI